MDGEVRLFKRKHSKVWQIAFTLDGRQVRVSSKKRILNDAVAAAREIYLDYRFRQKNGLPVISKRFADVAALCRATMKQQLDNGVGKKSFRDYIIVIDKYLVPFFGDIFVTSIDYEMLQKFARWREAKMGREPRSSTLNTHNSALNRIFDEAVARGYMNKSQVPVLVNKGRDSVRRPDFTREEYATLIRKLPSWIDAGREGKSRDMRHLLRDYILILANTGMRHGTEAENLRWKHISLFEDKGLKYLEMSVTGKTGRRDIICRAGTINYLKRIQSRCPDIADMSFEQLIKARLEQPVFRLPDGITPFQHEMRAAPAGRRQAQPGVATGHNVLAWQLGYVEVFIKKWYINWRLGKLSLCLIRTNSSLECKRRITAGSCPGNELVWTD
jgi:hypothetical protein